MRAACSLLFMLDARQGVSTQPSLLSLVFVGTQGHGGAPSGPVFLALCP